MDTIDPMVWAFVGYAFLLVAIGWAFDYLAHRAHKKTTRQKEGKFTYHESHDAWLCPEDQWLWPTSFDPENRVMRYRGNPSICNACPVKDTCTTSDHGRQMVREIDPWPHSETGRFHRGIALAVALMGLVLVLSMLLVYRGIGEIAVLAAASALLAVAIFPLAVFLWRSPANFPTGAYHPSRSGEEDQLEAITTGRYGAGYRAAGQDRTQAGTTYKARR